MAVVQCTILLEYLLSVVTSANDMNEIDTLPIKNNRLQFTATLKENSFYLFRLNAEHTHFLKSQVNDGCLRAVSTRSFQFHKYLYLIWIVFFFMFKYQQSTNFEIEMFVRSNNSTELLLIIIHFAFDIWHFYFYTKSREWKRNKNDFVIFRHKVNLWAIYVEIDTFSYYRLPTLTCALNKNMTTASHRIFRINIESVT